MLSWTLKYRLSIVIPIYNAELYIKECLDSVFTQLPSSVEIIIIDDGSPDRSIEIVKSDYTKWLASDQVTLIEQENAGPGAARNSGLSVARGEYVGFLDSDDVLLDDYFSNLIILLDNNEHDIIEFGFVRFYDISGIEKPQYKPLHNLKGIYKLDEIRNQVFSEGVWFSSTRVYKKSLFENIRFPEGVFYEDLMTIPFIFLRDLTVFFIDSPLIGYRYNPDSTTALHSESHAIDLYQFYLSLKHLEQTTAINILRIKVARSIVYFSNELGLTTIPTAEIIEDISQMQKGFSMLKVLKYPDLFFFMVPKMYNIVDNFRLKRKIRRN